MDIELISSVFSKIPLWDQKHCDHHNRYVLDKLWDAVAAEMKSTRAAVRSKWKTLRDTFRKELRKVTVVKHSGEEYTTPPKSSWQYFDSLYFLKDQFVARTSGGNLPSVQNCNVDNVSQDSSMTDNENTQDLAGDFLQNESITSIEKEITTQSDTPTLLSSHSGKGQKRKRQSEQQDEIGKALVAIEETKVQLLAKHSQKRSDDDMIFLESLLPYIRTLPPQQKLLLRMKIQETVYHFVFPQQPVAMQHTYNYNEGQQEPYSNPPSAASYLTGLSEDTH